MENKGKLTNQQGRESHGFLKSNGFRGFIKTNGKTSKINKSAVPEKSCFWLTPSGQRWPAEDSEGITSKTLQNERILLMHRRIPCTVHRRPVVVSQKGHGFRYFIKTIVKTSKTSKSAEPEKSWFLGNVAASRTWSTPETTGRVEIKFLLLSNYFSNLKQHNYYNR